MTATITGPDCRLPIGGGQCRYPSGHNGDCDPNPVTGAVNVTAYRRTLKRSRLRPAPAKPQVWCDFSRRTTETDHYAGADYCRDCGATDHPSYVDGAQ